LQRVWRCDHAPTKTLLARHLCRKATAVSLVVDSPQTFMPGALDARNAPLLISLTYGDTGHLSTVWLPWNRVRASTRLVVAPQVGGQVPLLQLPHPSLQGRPVCFRHKAVVDLRDVSDHHPDHLPRGQFERFRFLRQRVNRNSPATGRMTSAPSHPNPGLVTYRIQNKKRAELQRVVLRGSRSKAALMAVISRFVFCEPVERRSATSARREQLSNSLN
jgi:hypothetical protein